MQIETLRLFCDLVEAGSFSTAAEKHHVSQSAVSQRIAALERELGTKLLVRGRNTEATPEGRRFLKSAHQILEIYDDLRDHFRQGDREVAGDLHLATVYSIGLHELPPYLKWFRDRYPDVDVRVEYKRSDQVYHEVAQGHADLGLVAFPRSGNDLESAIFWQDRLVVICTPDHRFASREAVAPADLEGERFISFEPDLPTRKAIDVIFHQAGVRVNELMELDNVELVKRAVELEQAVSIVPQRTVYAEVEGGRLAQARLDAPDPLTIRPLGVIWQKGRESRPAVGEFKTLLQNKRLF